MKSPAMKSPALSVTMVILALFAAALNVLGTLDIPKYAVFDYDLDASGIVSRVIPDRAADAAGLHRGDRVVRINGIPFGPDAIRQASLVRIGGHRTLEIERDGQGHTLEMIARDLPSGDQIMGVVTGLSSLVFILGGLALYLRSSSTPAFILAAVGLTLGVAQGFRPVASTLFTRDLLAFTYTASGALCIPLMVHFGLVFPRRRKAARSPLWLTLLYAPAGVTIVLDASARLVPAWASQARSLVEIVTLQGQLFLVYMVIWLVLLVAGFLQTEAGARRDRGLYVLLIGTMAAIVPILVAGLITVIAPDFDASVLLVAFVPSLALPLVLGYAVWKSDGDPG